MPSGRSYETNKFRSTCIIKEEQSIYLTAQMRECIGTPRGLIRSVGRRLDAPKTTVDKSERERRTTGFSFENPVLKRLEQLKLFIKGHHPKINRENCGRAPLERCDPIKI